MKILGLHVTGGQSSAALLVDGQVVAAVSEERLNRIKQSRSFPRKAIAYCLQEAGLERPDELDTIAVSWNPACNMRNINLSGFTEWRRYDPEWLYIVPNNLMAISGPQGFSGDTLRMELGIDSRCALYFVAHHNAHLAHAVCQSPFRSGLAIAVDEYSEYESVTVAKFHNNTLDVVKKIAYPHSMGVFYAAITEYLGFTPNFDEWKVMGAAAYGNPERFLPALETIFEWDEAAGEWLLDQRFIEHSNMKRAGYLNERIERLIGIPFRRHEEPLEQCHFDLAAAAQNIFEKRLFQLLGHYAAFAQEPNLAAAGGCFMNSLANGKIVANTPFSKLFIPYAAADNGGAMGAALYVWHYVLGKERLLGGAAPSPYLGPIYSDKEIEDCLVKFKISYHREQDIAEYTAKQLAKGKLVGWFQGRMEFGERSLGNRSILADPRHDSMKEKINLAVKYREGFRPFAPAILSEHVSDWFDIPPEMSVPYMEQVYPVRVEQRNKVPAVVHHDGTGRLQTVDRLANPLFYSLIENFERITDIPIIINTSFNVQGEPIVCSPSDAIRTFFSCGLDVLVMGGFVVEKT